jgi:hypothetical protein
MKARIAFTGVLYIPTPLRPDSINDSIAEEKEDDNCNDFETTHRYS